MIAALNWLKNNPLYSNIIMNADRIAQLLPDNIPDKIMMCTRQLENEVILDEEHDTYILSDGNLFTNGEVDSENEEIDHTTLEGK